MTDTTTTPSPPTATAPPTTAATKPLFTDIGVDQDLADELRSRGIIHPFPIQELTLPLGLKGHDLIGQARTGTGKTLGFGLPLIQRIDPSRDQTQALVIVPTRELCIQVADDLTVGAGRGVTSIAVYGGVGYDEQIAALTSGVHVVVGTPGRTLDHLGRGNLDVSQVHTVVLDEADEMLDMGFLPDVERLLVDVPTQRQTLLFSATMPTAIVKLARRFMDKPTFMRADETLHETAPTVDQYFFLVHRMDKPRVLARLLQMPDRGGAFVFCRTKRMCDRLVQELEGLGVTAIAVHGDLRQSSRERNLDRFRAGTADVLVATEVAARGLDVDNVSHVVNYDCPDDEKMYLHRIGRTARAGSSGVAVTFAEFNEVDRVNVIRKRVGTDKELTEVFSTSDTLTDLFDLPATTPWDNLGSGSRSSRGSGTSKGSGSTKRKSSSGNRSSSKRGTATRSSAKGSDRRDSGNRNSGNRNSGNRDSGGRGSDRASTSRGRTSTDTPRPSRQPATASTSGSNRSSGRGTDQSAREDRDTSRRDQSTEASGRPRSRARSTSARNRSDDQANRTRTRTRTRSRRAESSRDTRSDSSPAPTTSTPSKDTKHTPPTTDGGSSTGRKRARRSRKRGGGSSGTRSDTTAAGGSGPDTSGAPNRGGRRRGANGSGAASDSDGRSSGSSPSTSGTRRTTNSGRGPTTTARGSEARGEGTPRFDRRVDVEHLP